ncbi:glycosyltransferase family 2 protein [Amphiplicatus metriothermophilus]|uniref:Glycosyltransferase 2-like domain-containing protein n=1 Tax=Amphiplicatus metriothermophilus TaxID=1519374 RepID=A0A239PJL7_9PROT|nr:glycosyltransferase family 2 protein [Amphiplicatus metriothermophilus]MBB5517849.1 hypothetical protein [Amphiplicatus metriothermophilus]SNT67817.1 hypothetical protein SAMN06297382_0310 [Amphiplicatus metriothermophilus]
MTTKKVASSPRIAVVTVNYGTADLVVANLRDLLAELEAFPGSKVYIVDNASPGGDTEKLAGFIEGEGLSARVRLIKSPVNIGFAGGNNLAFAEIRRAELRPDFVLLLNPDAAPQSGAVGALADFLNAKPRAGVAGARLENPDGSPRHAAFHFPSAGREFAGAAGIGFLQRAWPTVQAGAAAPCRVDWVSGAAMMLRAALLDEVGDMDAGYFLYFEETDYQRAAAARGWEIWHVPAARVVHAAGASTGMAGGRPRAGRMPAYWFASWLRYYAKNHGPAYARLAAAARLTGMMVCTAHRRLRGRQSGLADGFIKDFVRSCLMTPMPEDLARKTKR